MCPWIINWLVFGRCSSSTIGATNMGLGALDCSSPQLPVYEILCSQMADYNFHTIYNRPHSVVLSQLSWFVPQHRQGKLKLL
jgi:hypothetical protein